MHMRWLSLALLVGCAPAGRGVKAPAKEPVAAPPVQQAAAQAPGSEPAPAPVAVKRPALIEAAQGDGLIVSTKEGMMLLGPDLKPIKVLSRERGRHLRIADGQLYYFELKQPRLRALDLESGTTRAVAELPRLRNDCFEGGRAADPLRYVQGAADLDVAAGTMCIDIADQPGRSSTETINYRVELATGTVTQEKIAYFDGKVCAGGKGVTKPRLCTPGGESGRRERRSPSGKWSFTADPARGEKGEHHDYALVVVKEMASGREHVVIGRKLRAIRPMLEAALDSCMITPTGRAQWLGTSDVLVIEGCRDRLTVVLADGHIEHRQVDDFVVLPAG